MRNKLKQSKKCKGTTLTNKTQPRKDEVVLVLSDSSCSNDETSAEDAAAATNTRKVQTHLEQRTTRIAPIFLPRKQPDKVKESSVVKQDECAEQVQKPVLPPPPCEDVTVVERELQQRVAEREGSWRRHMSATALHSCLEEIQASNPAFPVRPLFSCLQNRGSEGLQEFGSRGKAPSQSSPQSHVKEKRKRENSSSERGSKRQRSSLSAESDASMGHCRLPTKDTLESEVMMVKKLPRMNKLSRSKRLKLQSQSPAGPEKNYELNSGLIIQTESDRQSLRISDISQRDASLEDLLWTDKYSPLHSSEVVGNSASVKKLKSWLKKWKQRADCEERRKMEERKREENSNDSWDCGDFRGEAGEEDEPVGNTVLITGPPGVGKTAAVYACSQELGFKVFEVNCSSQRSGQHVLSQLKEATQSHLVEMSGKNPLKPAYFNNYSCTLKSKTIHGKTLPPKNVPSALKKKAAQRFGNSTRKAKANPATVTLSNYFKSKAKADLLHSGGLSPSEKPDGKKYENPSTSSDQTASENQKTATSLILFEEVDVIFDDDVGFLAAIKTFMMTTKRPVILTTNDPSFKERFNCSVEEIIFKAPTEVNVCSYLQLVALAENVRLQMDDVSSLLSLTRGDIRHMLLQLQMWLHSAREPSSHHLSLTMEPMREQHSNLAERGHKANPQLHPCDTGFIASMLGLQAVTLKKLQNILKCQRWSEVEMLQLLRLLAESWRRAVPLLYTNLDLLLPVGAEETSVHSQDQVSCAGLQNELAASHLNPHAQQQDENVNQMESTTKKKPYRPISRLSRRKYHTRMNDAAAARSPHKELSSSQRAHHRPHSSRGKTEQDAAKLETYCLDTFIDYFDLMSYLDAAMPAATRLVSGSCKPEAFVWTGAEIKDGLLDEMSEDEEHMNCIQEGLLDIQAAVEGLGGHRCCWRLSEAWKKARNYRQELGDTRWSRLVERLKPPFPSRRQNLSFSFQPLCAPSISQRRLELSKKLLRSKSFSLLGNRRAVCVDYMPVLRYICRRQRAQQQTEKPLSRCLNYLSRIHLGLSKSTIQLLAEDFS